MIKAINDFLTKAEIKELIKRALDEDIKTGDATVLSIFTDEQSSAVIVAKEPGVIAGLPLVQEVFNELEGEVIFTPIKSDGDWVNPRDEVAIISGNAGAMLTGERTVMNFLGLLSGIATKAKEQSDIVAGKRLNILDTRKTTPGLRMVEKYAVQVGGAMNHRIGLFDMMMIKENHIRAAGSIAKAVELCKKNYPTLAVEVETTNLDEVKIALTAGANRIMLDNMSNEKIEEALKIIDNKVETEASGNMDSKRIKELADSGLDFISVGTLTHSIKSLDLSMLFKEGV